MTEDMFDPPILKGKVNEDRDDGPYLGPPSTLDEIILKAAFSTSEKFRVEHENAEARLAQMKLDAYVAKQNLPHNYWQESYRARMRYESSLRILRSFDR